VYGIVYFAGPKTRWAGKVDECEIIARTPDVRWRWLARAQLLNIHRQLDPSRCGYVLLDGDRAVEHYDPQLPSS
jgi:hypothetical protein